MTRTKMSARKSVGGPAEYRPLGASAEDESSDSDVEMPLVSKTPVTSEKFPPTEYRPVYLDLKSEDAMLCSGCNNGGDLVCCEAATHFNGLQPCGRAVCFGPVGSGHCVEIDGDSPAEAVFICPSCFQQAPVSNELGSAYTPYILPNKKPVLDLEVRVMKRGASFFSPLDIVTTGCISIHLGNIGIEPFEMTKLFLKSFYVTSGVTFVTEELNFDLSKKAQYSKNLTKLMKTIRVNRLRRIIVFFTTHSTDEGALHYKPGGLSKGASDDTTRVLQHLFPPSFRNLLKNLDTTLFIQACGGALDNRDSFDGFGLLAKDRTFDRIIGFTAKKLQPFFTAQFCKEYAVRVLLQRHSLERLTGVCADDTKLGYHTDVVTWHYTPSTPKDMVEARMQKMVVQKLVWCQRNNAPHGYRMSNVSCPECGSLMTNFLKGMAKDFVKKGGGMLLKFGCKTIFPPSEKATQPRDHNRHCNGRGSIPISRVQADLPEGTASHIGQWAVIDKYSV